MRTIALILGSLTLASACKDASPPAPRWIHKPSEIDRETWGRDCGGGVVPARLATRMSGDIWHVYDAEHRISVACSMSWGQPGEANNGQIADIMVDASHDEADHEFLGPAFQRALPVLYRELPGEVQAAARELASRRVNRKLWIRGFTMQRTWFDGGGDASEKLRVIWDPERIY